MLQVLLVDDEPFIVQGLSVLIDWKEEGYEIAATVTDGKKALDYLQNHTVDLIIADIKMPVMTGLELLEIIRKEEISDAYFVILSGYSDFGYARQAIRHQCIDYILKPVEKEELLEILRKVANMKEHTKKREETQQKFEQAYLARNVMALLFGKYDQMNLEYVKKHMHLSEGIRYIDIEFYRTNEPEEYEEGELRQLQRKLYQACQDFLKEDEGHCIFDVSQDEKRYDIGLLYCDYMAEKAGCNEVAYLETMRIYLEHALGHTIRMLAGKKVADIFGIAKSYSAACVLNSLEAFRTRKSIYFYEEEVQISQGGILLCKESLDALIGSIEQNDKMQIHKSVDRLYEEMKQMGVAGDTVKLNINYLLFQLIHLATQQDDGVNQEEILHYISESSFEEGILRGSSLHLTRFACQYAEYLAQLRKNVSRGILSEIEREIRENYAQNLTLRELSQKYYINSAYLGQIFRKKYGVPFKDYLNNYRMDQAAMLLLRTDEKIYQIAQEVGYKDLDYFINRFIAAKGCTPAKFRKQGSIAQIK